VRQGYVSKKAAREFYGAAFDSQGHIDRDATAMRRTDMRRRGLPKDRPFSTEDHSGWGGCPYCTKLLQPHPDGRAMAIEAAASGISQWRCC
jgi:hypothetical protein